MVKNEANSNLYLTQRRLTGISKFIKHTKICMKFDGTWRAIFCPIFLMKLVKNFLPPLRVFR